MEKAELARMLAAKLDVKPEAAAAAINEVIAEMVSPRIFTRPGEPLGFMDNNCNSCREPQGPELQVRPPQVRVGK